MSGALESYMEALALRLSVAWADTKNALARGAVARAYESIGDIFSTRGDQARALHNYQGLLAQIKELEVLLAQASKEADILRARLERLEPRRRRHYSPRQRFRTLPFMKTCVMSVAETCPSPERNPSCPPAWRIGSGEAQVS